MLYKLDFKISFYGTFTRRNLIKYISLRKLRFLNRPQQQLILLKIMFEVENKDFKATLPMNRQKKN